MANVVTTSSGRDGATEVAVLRGSGVPLRRFLSAKTIEKLEFTRYMVDTFVRFVRADLKPGARLLDAGAGECWYKPLFSHTDYLSIDFCKADERLNYAGLDVVGDLCELPIRSESFDAVLATEVLEHICEPGAFLAEVFRVLKPGGVLYLTVPFGVHEHQAPYDFYRYTSFGLRHLFEKSGMEIEFIEPLGGYFLCAARILYQFHRRLFNEKQPAALRAALLPLRPFSKLFFRLLVPAVCYKLDRYVDSYDYTLGYACKCTRPGGPSPSSGSDFSP